MRTSGEVSDASVHLRTDSRDLAGRSAYPSADCFTTRLDYTSPLTFAATSASAFSAAMAAVMSAKRPRALTTGVNAVGGGAQNSRVGFPSLYFGVSC
jgi:hypothetical protein